MEGLKFVYILEQEYREHLRREILAKKKGKSRKLTNKDKEFIDQKCFVSSFKPTVQTVALPPAPQQDKQEEQAQPSPRPQQEGPQEVAQETSQVEAANCSPPSL